jgi:hypothetical protein
LLTFVQAVHFLSVLAGSSLVVDVVVVVVLSTIVSEVASDAGVALVAVGLDDGSVAFFLLLDLGSKGRSEKKEVMEGLLGLGCFCLRGRATLVFSMYSLLPSSVFSPLLVLLLYVVAAGPVVVAALLFESSPSRSNAARARRIRPGAGYSSGGGR